MIQGANPEAPHGWLEQNETPEVQAWLEKQAAITDDYFQSLPVRKRLHDRLQEMFSLRTIGQPCPYGERYYHSRRPPDRDMSMVYLQENLKDEPRVVLDPHTFSDDHTVTLSGWHPSRDGQMITFGRSAAGNDRRSLHVLDIETGKELSDVVPDDCYPAFNGWNTDGTGFFYTRRDLRMPNDNPKLYKRLYYHELGADWKDDELVFGDGRDKSDIISGGVTKDGRYLIVSVYS